MDRLHFTSGRAAVPLADDAPMPAEGFVWLDLSYDEVEQLAPQTERLTGVRIFEDHIADARNLAHPSFFDNTADYELVIFRGLAPGEQSERLQTRPTALFNFDRVLVTVRAPDSVAASQVKTRYCATPGRAPRNPDELMHRLLSAMVDRYLDLRAPLNARLEHWQRALLDTRKPFNDWLGMLQARNDLRKLENLCEEQLDAVQEWRDARFQDIAPELQVRFTDLIEHIDRVLSHVRRIEQQAESAVQLHFAAMSHRTSGIMRTLTLITAVFMPLTLITGVFGMNFDFIPGLHSGSGFWWSLAGMLAVVAGLLLYFRVRKWI